MVLTCCLLPSKLSCNSFYSKILLLLFVIDRLSIKERALFLYEKKLSMLILESYGFDAE
jgi:hypothetical protein